MRTKIFTLFICLLTGATFSAYAQTLNLGTGVTWGELNLGASPLLLDEDFTGYDHNHTDENTDQGNSQHVYDTDGVTIIYGYFNSKDTVPILGSTSGNIYYEYFQSAFAPEWETAWGFRDGGGQTENVSNGFVELSRFDTIYSAIPTAHGYMQVDLRELDFVDGIQWTHSSTGGNKRGVMCEFSLDDGATWDTLRYQPGNSWALSFTKDPLTGTKTPNGYRCDPSAYGMTWEDGIYASNVMLRFGECGGQTARIHDLKVYGTYLGTSAEIIDANELRVFAANKKIRISEEADVQVYNITGALVKQVNLTNSVSMNGMPNGIYLVKAQSGHRITTAKVYIQ